MNKWKERYSSHKPIPYHEIKMFRDEQINLATKNNIAFNTLITATEHIQIILNYFENIALAIDNNIADNEVLKKAFLCTFERWYNLLSDYKRTIIDYREFDPWAPLDILFIKWFPQKNNLKEKSPKSKTGQIDN